MSTQIILTNPLVTSWTVPSDWNNVNNTIEVIGAGGGGAGGDSNRGGGGGGAGAYSKISNLSLTIGASISYLIGTGGPGSSGNGGTGGTSAATAGGDTYFNGASLGASSVGAKGGGGATAGGTGGGGGGSGGSAASGVGTTKNDGGSGGSTTGFAGAGGGGAAGGSGVGANGSTVSGSTGGTGGTGDNGAGGTGGNAENNGGNGTEWTTAGSGGGAGGGNNGHIGRTGGNYGGAGSGAGLQQTGGTGANGVIVITYTAQPSDLYWIGGTGNWDASTTTHWSTSSGGTTVAAVPTATTNVHFDSSSGGGVTTITATANTLDLNTTGFTGTIGGSSALNVSGSLTLIASVLSSYTGAVSFLATSSGKTVTMAGNSVGSMTFNGSGGVWTLSGSVTLTGTGTVWNWTTGTLTSPGSGTITINDASSSSKTFAGGGQTYNNLYITGGGTGAYTISGSNTFQDFKVDTPPHTVNFTAGTTQTVNTFTVNGTAGNLMTLQSTSTGSLWYLKKSPGGQVSCDYLSLQDSDAS